MTNSAKAEVLTLVSEGVIAALEKALEAAKDGKTHAVLIVGIENDGVTSYNWHGISSYRMRIMGGLSEAQVKLALEQWIDP